MSKWKETNKYGIRESKAAYWRYTRRMDKEAEILKELEPQPPTHVDLTGLETYIQRLRESKEPTMDDNYLIWFDVETSGLDPMSDNLLEVEARITDMKGLRVPFTDDPLIFHRVIRFDDNTPICAFNSTTIDMHSRNGLIGECMNAEDTLKNVDKQMAVWLSGTGLDPGLMHPAGTNVHFDIRWLDVNMPNTSGILHKLSHRRLDLTSFRLLQLAHDADAGLDLHCIEDFHIDGLDRITVGTGIAINLPEGYMARVCPRSGLARNYGIDILGGIIDAGYRGEIKVILHNTSTSRINFRRGDRIAQLVITPVETPRIRKVVEFTDTTERGGNGFGSTGR